MPPAAPTAATSTPVPPNTGDRLASGISCANEKPMASTRKQMAVSDDMRPAPDRSEPIATAAATPEKITVQRGLLSTMPSRASPAAQKLSAVLGLIGGRFGET